MHVKHISKCVEMKNDTLELVLRSDPNSVAQNIKQSCVLFCLESTYKKVGGKMSCTIHKKIKVNTSTNLMKLMKIYCTQI